MSETFQRRARDLAEIISWGAIGHLFCIQGFLREAAAFALEDAVSGLHPDSVVSAESIRKIASGFREMCPHEPEWYVNNGTGKICCKTCYTPAANHIPYSEEAAAKLDRFEPRNARCERLKR